MLRRFMSWLLHQLQKFLSLISGQHSSARRVTPAQENPKTQDVGTAQQGSYSAPTEADTPTQAGISFSIESADSSASRPPMPQPDAIQKAIANADDATDTHTRLDAASSAIPGSHSELSDVEDAANEARFSKGGAIACGMASLAPTPSETIPLVDHLPSIHDLLPAVEQEIKESAAQHSADNIFHSEIPASDPALSLTDSAPSSSQPLEIAAPQPEPAEPELAVPAELPESERQDSELPEPEITAESEQALLFSFDITESADDKASDIEVANRIDPDAVPNIDISDGELSDVENLPALVEDDIDIVTSALTEADASAEPLQKRMPPLSEADTELSGSAVNDVPQSAIDIDINRSEDSKELPTSEDLNPTALYRASLPYPWSIATPKNSSDTDEKTVVQPEALNPREASVDTDSTIESEAIQLSTESVSTQPPQKDRFSTKSGVVKLLFTMKEGNFHGYIEPKDGTSDILFHQKYINEDIFDSLERGVEVVVSVKYMEGKAYATQVELAE